ncbi:MAG: thioredoxin family protein [Patescibacteria group bacterium]|nr:MAG: thioredoxin family protein [Patescibacteria group bacterium]
MKNTFALTLGSALFVLVGAGCTTAPVVPDLPTEPPAMMQEEKEADAMEKKEDAMMEGERDNNVMMEKEGDAIMEDGGGVRIGGAMLTEDEAEVANEMMAPEPRPYYIAYTETAAASALQKSRAVVYYFWASWCPICRAEEPKIKTWIENSNLPVAGFRVNYDTEAALKAKYKIPYQHTTVFLNAKGEEVERFNGPVEEATFMAALKKATQ